MDTKTLKDKILQLAIQGKLVSQDENDEPASVLLEKIKKEKEQLVKDKVIKKEKPLPEISDDEKLFELPRGWEFSRLGNVIKTIIGGGTPSKSNPLYWNGDIRWASVKDMTESIFINDTVDSITIEGLKNSSSNLIPKGNLIVSTRMGLGKININKIDIAINQDLKAILLTDDFDIKYFYYMYMNLNITGTGTTVKGIKQEDLLNIIIAVPPLEEQKRIVAKVDLLFKLIDELDSNKQYLLQNISDAKSKMIQLAIQGKLIPQNESDEPASVLLERIKEKKEQLLKDKIIKKEKPLSDISNEEKLFELPRGWEFARLGNVIKTIIGGGTPSKSNPLYWNGNIRWASVKDMTQNVFLNDTVDSITIEGLKNSSSNLIPKGNLIISTRMGLGKININKIDIAINQDLKAILLTDDFDIKYFYYMYMNLNITGTGTGTTVKGIKQEDLLNIIIAVPPLEEQKRIVAKLDTVINYFDILEKQIS